MDYALLFDLGEDNPVSSLSEIELSYIAGLIDGEGYIGIVYQKSEDYFRAAFKISTCDLILVPWLAQKLQIPYKTYSKPNPNYNDYREITLAGISAVSLIIKVLPYLKLKVRQAELFLELVYTQGQVTKKYGRTVSNYDSQKRIYLEMKELNERKIRQ